MTSSVSTWDMLNRVHRDNNTEIPSEWIRTAVIPHICQMCHKDRLYREGLTNRSAAETHLAHHDYCPRKQRPPQVPFSMAKEAVQARCKACRQTGLTQSKMHDFGCPGLRGARTRRETPDASFNAGVCLGCVDVLEHAFNLGGGASLHHRACPYSVSQPLTMTDAQVRDRRPKQNRTRERLDMAWDAEIKHWVAQYMGRGPPSSSSEAS